MYIFFSLTLGYNTDEGDEFEHLFGLEIKLKIF